MPLTVKFEPKVDDGKLLKGEWVETTLKCNIKGGYFPAGQQAAFSIDVVLRGLVT